MKEKKITKSGVRYYKHFLTFSAKSVEGSGYGYKWVKYASFSQQYIQKDIFNFFNLFSL
jgi:hypothetical protein